MAVNLADIQRIQQHLESEGVDVENVLSDIKELAERDPTLFTGIIGEDAQRYLRGAEEQIAAGEKGEIYALYMALNRLEDKLKDLHVRGGKHRRKTRKARRNRRKTLKSRR